MLQREKQPVRFVPGREAPETLRWVAQERETKVYENLFEALARDAVKEVAII